MDGFKVLELSQKLEQKFARFGYELPFDRDSIVINPTDAIEQGLERLNAIGAISDNELKEHIGNYSWGDMKLEQVLETQDREEQIAVLLRNLDGWFNRYKK